jgi:hypothetical protein
MDMFSDLPRCYYWVLATHLLAIPLLYHLSNKMLKALFIIYIFNECIVHTNKAPTFYNYWGRAIVVALFIYISSRFFMIQPKTRAWYQALLVYLFWVIMELLYSQSVGWYPNQPGVKNPLCYEIIIHICLWVCLYLLFYLQPSLRK